MARKKLAHSQHVPEEERPEFLAALAELPAATEVAALAQLSADSLALLNDAMRGNAPEQVERARLLSSAVIYRLNGDTFFGCNAENGAKTRLLASQKAAPGQLPCWGQDGEWYAEVDGMRMWIESRNWMGGDTVSLAFHAVDADQPFLSDTGYRSHFLNRRHWLGHEFGAAVRLELEQLLQTKDWKPKPIRDEHRARLEVPTWLVSALEGVMGNGQQALPLSGLPQPAAVAAAPVEKKIPMDNAERQRRHRKRQKEKRERAKAEGLRTVELSGLDLGRLFIALDTHITFDKPLDADLKAYQELATRLFAGDALVHHIHLLGTSEGLTNKQKQQNKDAKRGWEAYERECERTSGLVNKVNDLQAENAHIKRELAAIAAELGGAPLQPAAPAVDVAALQAEVARLQAELEKQHAENLFTIAEQGKAASAVSRLQRRLENAGLPSDYRALPGEL